jgi:hypothetical protein
MLQRFIRIRFEREILKEIEKEYHKLLKEDFDSRCFSVNH